MTQQIEMRAIGEATEYEEEADEDFLYTNHLK